MNKKALILDGRIGEDAMAERSLEVVDAWLTAHDCDATVLSLRELAIAPCLGCFGCWIKTPGECVIDDAGRDVARNIVGSDLVVYLTPIQFGGYSFELKKALDRSIAIISPMFRKIRGEVHHRKRYAHYPRVLALGWLERGEGDEEDIFQALVQRNAINMHAPKALAEVFEIGVSEKTVTRRIEGALAKLVGS